MCLLGAVTGRAGLVVISWGTSGVCLDPHE